MSKTVKNACLVMLLDKRFDKNNIILIQPLEFCISFYDENYEYISSYFYQIKPEQPISPRVLTENNIKASDYENGISLQELNDRLANLKELKELVANNGFIRNHTYGSRSNRVCLKYLIDKLGGSSVATGLSMVNDSIQEYTHLLCRKVIYENKYGYRGVAFSDFKIKDAYKILVGDIDISRLSSIQYLCEISHEVSKWVFTQDEKIILDAEDEADAYYINKYNRILFENMNIYLRNSNKEWVKPFKKFIEANGWVFDLTLLVVFLLSVKD